MLVVCVRVPFLCFHVFPFCVLVCPFARTLYNNNIYKYINVNTFYVNVYVDFLIFF